MKTNGDERRETSDERREGGRAHTAVFGLCVVVTPPQLVNAFLRTGGGEGQ